MTCTHYAPTLVDPPAEAPVTIEEARAQCGVSGTDDDVLLSLFIDAATSSLDGYTGRLGRCIVAQTWAQTFDAFDTTLRLPFPALSIQEINYIDSDGETQTVNDETFALRRDSMGSFVELKSGQSWPTPADEAEAVTVSFVAGFGDAADVPAAIKAAILLMVSNHFSMAKRDLSMKKRVVEGIGSREYDVAGEMAAAVDETVFRLIRQYAQVVS